MDRIDSIISTMIDRWEGGYSHHPADRGGPTKFGITAKTLADYLRRPVTAETVRALPRSQALAIYRERYWHGANIDRLSEPLQPVVFDMAVNLGPANAVRVLQQALGDLGHPIIGDGIIGKVTAGVAARALERHGARRVVDAICDRRRDYYTDLIARNPSQKVFRNGWFERCESYRLLS
ncbi:MAG: hypothetical protein RLZZ598_743 [Pseudomonadota bacterium]